MRSRRSTNTAAGDMIQRETVNEPACSKRLLKAATRGLKMQQHAD